MGYKSLIGLVGASFCMRIGVDRLYNDCRMPVRLYGMDVKSMRLKVLLVASAKLLHKP